MRQLRDVEFEDLVFLNIETARVQQEVDEESPLFESWKYRFRKSEEPIDLKKEYIDKASMYPEFAKIVCISLGRIKKGEVIITSYSGEEKNILLMFNRDLKKVMDKRPKTKICGHSCKSFSITFIFKRCIVNQVIPVDLIDVGGMKPWEVSSVDIKELWKSISFYSSSLVNTAVSLGVKGAEEIKEETNEVFYTEGIDKVKMNSDKRVFVTINTTSIMGFRNPFKDYETKDSDEWKEMGLLERLSYTGKVSIKDREKIIEIASGYTVDEKQVMITNLKASLAYRKGKLSQEIELEILSA